MVRRKHAFDPKKSFRIGLMKTVAIGDTILVTGIARDVKATYPACTLVAITGADNRGVVDLVPEFDERIIVRPHHPIASVLAVRAGRLDVLLDFGPWPRFDAALAAMSGASFIAGFEAGGQGRHFAYDVTVPHSRDVHEVENFRRIAATIGVQSTSLPRLNIVSANDARPGRRYVVFHAWPGGYRQEVKEWPTDRWVALGIELATRGYSIMLTGGARDTTRCADLANHLRGAGVNVDDVAGRRTLAETAALLARASCVVSVNTGIMHLAAAVGAPTVSLDGPTSAARWGPIGDRVRSVESTFPGCGYLQLGWEYDGQRLDCMRGVGVDAVLAAVSEVAVS
jgi:heptosyltransferase III